jgi:sugar O-acyltransferase (sialic acid O-acetyltransferase NeuD family)
MKKLAIIGAGDLGELIAHHAQNDNHFEVIGFYDDFFGDNLEKGNDRLLGATSKIEADFIKGVFNYIMVGVGYKFMQFRKSIFQKLNTKVPFANIIHSSSYVDPSVKLGDGIFILPGCTIDKDVIIGNNVLINTAAVIAHDSTIKDHCFISPAASIAGKTVIEESCIIGINATIIDNLTIAPFSQIAGGAVVIDNISKSGLYAGIPAVFKRKLL